MTRRNTYLAAILIILLGARFGMAECPPDEVAPEAAYLGDVDVLRGLLGQNQTYQSFADAGVRPENILKFALIGRQYEVIRMLTDYGFPKRKSEAAPIFGDKHMTVEAADLLLASVPGFATTQGPNALEYAVRANRIELCRALLDGGVQATQEALAAAFLHRNIDLIGILIANGADPYLPARGISPVQQAIRIKSADLTKVLDVEGRYDEDLARLEKNYRPKGGSQLIGTWKYSPPGGGFGFIVLTFYPDGTAFFGADIGGVFGIWKEEGKSVELVPLNEKGEMDQQQTLTLERTGAGLAVSSASDSGTSESRIVKKIEPSEEISEWRYPPFIRVEKVFLTADQNLMVQINRRHISIPLSQLVEASQETRYGMEPVEGNLLRWDDFIDAPLDSQEGSATAVPYNDRMASPMYSKKWQNLGFNHSTLASVDEGQSYTLFRSTTTKRYHGPDTGRYGEALQGYALLADKPFPHGKDWLMFFFMKSKDNK